MIKAIMSLDDEREDVKWVKEQILKKPTVEFSYLKKLVKYITFDGWDTLKVEWIWGLVTRVPFEVSRAADYPDLTLNGNRIGHFTLRPRQYDQIAEANEKVKETIRGTRIIDDVNHRFSCPPYVVSGVKKKPNDVVEMAG